MELPLKNRLRIVSIGGGSGLARLLQGLKQFVVKPGHHSANQPQSQVIADLTGIVTVTDDGGSSGRLRHEFQILPPGDIRKCLVALSEDELLMSRLFQYRFPGEGDLQGHSFGNLFLTALANVTGDFVEAIRLSSEVLAIKGRILPATTEDVRLIARLENGACIFGEHLIGRTPIRISQISILPESPAALPETLEAIAEADILTLGPGSLFTSLLPSLLVQGIPQAIRASRARKLLIMNIMTQAGETLDFTASDHLDTIRDHCGEELFEAVICNQTAISEIHRRKYADEDAAQIELDLERMKTHDMEIVLKDLLAEDEKVRHDPVKLARTIFEFYAQPTLSSMATN